MIPASNGVEFVWGFVLVGSGIVNLVTPTSAVVMGGLAIARIGYGTWLRFVWPVLLGLMALCAVGLAIAAACCYRKEGRSDARSR